MADSHNNNTLNVEAIMNWPFKEDVRAYDAGDCQRYADAFGAGLAGELYEGDQGFLQGEKALPVMAVPLADGEFWQQNAKTGITWQKMVHAGEAITLHRPLKTAAKLQLTQQVDRLLDRGADRGAVMLQKLLLSDEQGPVVTIDVSTILLADGGFGGEPDNRPRDKWVPDDKPADASVELKTPVSQKAKPLLFELNAGLAVAAGAKEGQKPLRGVCSFGVAGRAALHLLCGNQSERLKYFSVRYAGMMYSDETMRVEVWYLSPGKAALRMTAVEREALVLNHCLVEYTET